MIDSEPRRALDCNMVHEARLGVHGNSAFLHPLCDPKVRWDPAQETRRQAITCLECIAALDWIDQFMGGMPLEQYFELHQAKRMVDRGQ